MKKPIRFNRASAMALAKATLAGDLSLLLALAKAPGDWGKYGKKLLAYLQGGCQGKPPFKIFMKGNGKLPFSTFSALPIITCPGAGACGKFCYSFTAWRYPCAFFRQLQNSVLMASPAGQSVIASAFKAMPPGVFRLYVDGDFKNVQEVKFWMSLISSHPDIQAYGYSKSWLEFIGAKLAGTTWPENYMLNLSSGSKHGVEIRRIMETLPITRGEFLAFGIDSRHIRNRAYHGPHKDGWLAYSAAIRAEAQKQNIRVFVCKGSCGSCMPDGSHACGSARFKGVSIAIGTH